MTLTDLQAPPDCPPTHFYVPDGARFTIADEAADFMSAVGYQVDEPERQTLHALAPQRANGDWIGLESGIVGPRQNLKTACKIGLALHDLFVQQVDRVVWTAHEFKTSSDAFKDIRAIVEGTDWLWSEVKHIRISNGKEGIDLTSGGRLDVIARTGKSGRGMAAPRLYLDEAIFLEPSMMGALIPIMSAKPNAHIVYGSSPGVPKSLVLRGLRKRGRSGVDPNLGWIEWSQERGECAAEDCRHEPGTPGCWLDDLDAVLRVNPAAGRRITLDYLEQERLALAAVPDEYLRERMGVWEDPLGPDDTDPLLPNWDATSDFDVVVPDGASAAWTVDVQWLPPGSGLTPRAWVGVGVEVDGKPVVQLVHVCDPAQVVAWLDEHARRRPLRGIGIQGTGAPASGLLDSLRQTFDEPHREVVHALTGPEMSRACTMAATATRTGEVVRRRVPADDPSASIDAALDASINSGLAKQLADGWVIDRQKSPVDAAPATAWVNAHYLLVTTPEVDVEPGVWFL